MLWLDLGEYRGPSRFHAFVLYCSARMRQRAVQSAYRNYVTESLRLAPQGKALGRSFSELVTPRKEIDVEATIDRIAAMVGGEE